MKKIIRGLGAVLRIWASPALAVLIAAVIVLGGVWMLAPRVAHGQQDAGMTGYFLPQVFDSRWYNYGSPKIPGAHIAIGNSATGSQTITVCPAIISLPNGRNINVFQVANATFSPITVDPTNGTVAETVTPTAVSLVARPASDIGNPSVQCAAITASFSNVHGASQSPYQVKSGDFGIQEAINDASNQGGGDVYWQADTGNVTLLTSGLTTTTSVSVPKNFISFGASARVNTTITTSANWSVGIAGSTAAFCASNSTLTAGTTCTVNSPASVAQGLGITPVIFTMGTSNPGAGAIHARVWGHTTAQTALTQ